MVKFVNVGVEDFGKEVNFGGCYGVVVWEKEFKFEDVV